MMTVNSKKLKAIRLIWLLLLILWCVFIFSNSLTPATQSSQNSRGIRAIINEFFQQFDPDFYISHHFVRKMAHFVEFFVLGTILFLYSPLWKKSGYATAVNTAFSGLLIAITDETLQLFTPGREGAVKDIWLDFSAVVTAHIACLLIFVIIKHIRYKKSL